MGMQPDEQGVFFQVTVVGTSGGVFVYDSAGNLVASMADVANVDPLTQSNLPGVVSYLAGFPADYVQLLAGHINMHAGTETQAGGIGENLPGVLAIASGEQTGADSLAEVFLLSKAAAGTGAPVVLVNGSSPDTAAALEVRGSLAVGPSLGNIREWYAPSGGDDFAALNTALSSYGSADLLPGTYELSAQLNIAGACLQGCDMATVIQPFGAYAGVLVSMGGQSSMRNLSLQSGGSDAVRVASGVAEWWLEDLFFASNAGFCINANSVTAPTHGRIRGIRGSGGGSANGGGIAINGGTGGAITAEVNIYDVDIQNCTTSEVLFLSAVTDVLAFEVNGGIKSGVAANGVTIQGACQTCALANFDVGGGSGTGVLVFKAAGGNNPTEIAITSGKFQGGAVGVVVNDGSARLGFTNVYATRNQGDGFQWNGNGAFNTMTACVGNNNNQAAGTAYDVNITSTAHLLMNGFAGVSGAVTASRNITLAGNHVTSVNEPATNTNAGNAPAGW